MKSDKDDKSKPDQNSPNVHTPEPPQVMDPSKRPKKNGDGDNPSKSKKKEKKKKG
jgi:hypothetical protein